MYWTEFNKEVIHGNFEGINPHLIQVMFYMKVYVHQLSYPIHRLKLQAHGNKLFDSLKTIQLNQFLVIFGHVL